MNRRTIHGSQRRDSSWHGFIVHTNWVMRCGTRVEEGRNEHARNVSDNALCWTMEFVAACHNSRPCTLGRGEETRHRQCSGLAHVCMLCQALLAPAHRRIMIAAAHVANNNARALTTRNSSHELIRSVLQPKTIFVHTCYSNRL